MLNKENMFSNFHNALFQNFVTEELNNYWKVARTFRRKPSSEPNTEIATLEDKPTYVYEA
jgi:hypothetical protein